MPYPTNSQLKRENDFWRTVAIFVTAILLLLTSAQVYNYGKIISSHDEAIKNLQKKVDKLDKLDKLDKIDKISINK